jgi:SRSO17 transposase
MFLTRIASTVSGRSTKQARRSCAPDGRLIGEFSLACGNGSVKYPTMYVKVCVWEALAEKSLAVIDRKGLNIETSGFLLVKQYEGKYGKSVLIELIGVREIKVFDVHGDLKEVLSDEVAK